MTVRRFYVPPDAFGDSIRLGEDESRHLSKVLRLGPGDEVRLFDGHGRESIFAIEDPDRRRVPIRFVKDTQPSAPESGLDLTLAVPLLKKSNTELVLQKAVELGVKRFVPLICARGEVAAKKWKAGRSHRIAVESAKQCGRATVPEIAEPIDFERFIVEHQGTAFLFHEAEGGPLPDKFEGGALIAVTGPEGGWEDSEVELAAAGGFTVVHFGGRILRAETAAIAVTAILQHRFGDMNER